jgi:cytochrome c
VRGVSLGDVIDRRVASIDGYNYSRAMQAAGGMWSRERLDAFLANPSATVPGTTMQFGGIADPQVRRALIDYLEDPESELNVPVQAGEL